MLVYVNYVVITKNNIDKLKSIKTTLYNSIKIKDLGKLKDGISLCQKSIVLIY